jgi:hypothetical protein
VYRVLASVSVVALVAQSFDFGPEDSAKTGVAEASSSATFKYSRVLLSDGLSTLPPGPMLKLCLARFFLSLASITFSNSLLGLAVLV